MDSKGDFKVKSNEEIQAKLDKKLGPEYISKRIGFGSSRVAYIEGWKVINLANQIFGFNGWSTEVKNVMVDFLDERQGKFNIGCTAIVRVTLENGTYREDIGYGTVENERRKSAAFERAKKSAVTDALKRSLRGFGNALGNCLYDKEFLSRIDKVKFDPPDFDEGNLFRPSDEISEASRTGTTEATDPGPPSKRRHLANLKMEPPPAAAPQREAQRSSEPREGQTKHTTVDPDADQDELLDDSLMFSDDFQDDDLISMGEKPEVPPNNQVDPVLPQPSTGEDPITFVNAKGAKSLQDKSPVSEENVFDPKYHAQSVRHTIDQSTSKHVPMTVLKEKGIDFSRDAVYQDFAPKGKQIGSTSPTKTNTNDTSSVTNTGTKSRFAPPTSVVHPNSSLLVAQQPRKAPMRREVGRPKVNPLHLRKPSP